MLSVEARDPQPLKFCKLGLAEVSKLHSFPGESEIVAGVGATYPALASTDSELESIVDCEGKVEARESRKNLITCWGSEQAPMDDNSQEAKNFGTDVDVLHRPTMTSMEWKDEEDPTPIQSNVKNIGEAALKSSSACPEISQGYSESFRRYISLKQLVRDLPLVPVDDQGLTKLANACAEISTTLAQYQKERQQKEICAPDSFCSLTMAAEALCALGTSRDVL